MDPYALRLVYSPEQIAERVAAIATEIDVRYGFEPVLAVCVLKGAFIFFADLCRALRNPLLEQDFVRVSSYGSGNVSSGAPRLTRDLELSPHGRHVIIVEDIVDSGHTMDFLLRELAAREPLSIAVATLLDKKERREKDIPLDYRCFESPPGFFVGYGLDYDEKYRGLPGIYNLQFPQNND